jgi:hypothetical protein
MILPVAEAEIVFFAALGEAHGAEQFMISIDTTRNDTC